MKKLFFLFFFLYSIMTYCQNRYEIDSIKVESTLKNIIDPKGLENIMYIYSDQGELIFFDFNKNCFSTYKLSFRDTNFKKKELRLKKKEKKEVLFIYENLEDIGCSSVDLCNPNAHSFLKINYYLRKDSKIIRGCFFTHCKKNNLQQKVQQLLQNLIIESGAPSNSQKF